MPKSLKLRKLLMIAVAFVTLLISIMWIIVYREIREDKTNLVKTDPATGTVFALPNGHATPYVYRNGFIEFEDQPVLGVDLKTFRVIGEIENIPSTNFYAVDSSHVYEDGHIIQDADPGTFEVLTDYQALGNCHPHASSSCTYYDLKDSKHKFNGSILVE